MNVFYLVFSHTPFLCKAPMNSPINDLTMVNAYVGVQQAMRGGGSNLVKQLDSTRETHSKNRLCSNQNLPKCSTSLPQLTN